MASYEIEELRINISAENTKYKIPHQKSRGRYNASLMKIRFEFLELYNATSFADILFVTNTCLQGIDLTKFRTWATKEGNNIVLSLTEIHEFSDLGSPNMLPDWIMLTSKYRNGLKGLLRGKVEYL